MIKTESSSGPVPFVWILAMERDVSTANGMIKTESSSGPVPFVWILAMERDVSTDLKSVKEACVDLALIKAYSLLTAPSLKD
nr:hypothetical protein [Tanacetum cinerariifolium]